MKKDLEKMTFQEESLKKIQSFIKSNIWTLLPSGKSKFKKGDIVDCYLPNYSQKILIH